jgi:hypothetical protein
MNNIYMDIGNYEQFTKETLIEAVNKKTKLKNINKMNKDELIQAIKDNHIFIDDVLLQIHKEHESFKTWSKELSKKSFKSKMNKINEGDFYTLPCRYGNGSYGNEGYKVLKKMKKSIKVEILKDEHAERVYIDPPQNSYVVNYYSFNADNTTGQTKIIKYGDIEKLKKIDLSYKFIKRYIF